ncbi:hypothetical protein K435DRAFT_624613, partial [Dendrothele bispora CBS 962.96]
HASFSDYILQQDRSQEFFCDSQKYHSLLTNSCFNVMNKKLRFNICHLPSSFLKDIEIQDIKSRIQACIDEDLQYSCNFWGFHLEKSNFSKEISNNLELFLNEKGLFWIEAMNIMGVISRGQP